MSTRLRPTPIGTTAVAAVVSLAAVGWSFGYAAMSIAAVGGAIGIILAALATIRTVEVDVERRIEPSRVERGAGSAAFVMVTNRRARRSAPLSVGLGVGGTTTERPVPALGPHRSAIAEIDLPTARRGAYVVEPVQLIRSDPADLFRSTRSIGEPSTLLVRPRIHLIDPRPGGRFRHVDGLSASSGGGTITFQALRDYVPGDDIKNIHWRSSARVGSLMVRERVDTNLPSTVVVLDVRASSYASADDFESAVDVAASIVDASRRSGFLLRFITTDGTTLVLRAGQRGRDVDDFLASVQLDHDTTDASRARDAVARGRERDAIAVVTGDLDDAGVSSLTQLTDRFGSRSLVTIRPDDVERSRWLGGAHLDGSDSERALARWNQAVST